MCQNKQSRIVARPPWEKEALSRAGVGRRRGRWPSRCRRGGPSGSGCTSGGSRSWGPEARALGLEPPRPSFPGPAVGPKPIHPGFFLKPGGVRPGPTQGGPGGVRPGPTQGGPARPTHPPPGGTDLKKKPAPTRPPGVQDTLLTTVN